MKSKAMWLDVNVTILLAEQIQRFGLVKEIGDDGITIESTEAGMLRWQYYPWSSIIGIGTAANIYDCAPSEYVNVSTR